MTIEKVELHPVTVDRVYHTRVAQAGMEGDGKSGSRYVVLELVTDSGLSGIGEVSDLEDAWKVRSAEDLRAPYEEAVLRKDPLEHRVLCDRFLKERADDTHPEMCRMMAAALETALLDLAGKHYGVPVYEVLGGRRVNRLAVSWVAYIRGAELLVDEIQRKVDEGFCAFKLKVGDDFEADTERVRILRRIAGSQAYVKIDASGAWEEEEAIQNLKRFAELGVEAVETPVSAAGRALAKDHPEEVNVRVDEVAEAIGRVRNAIPMDVIEHVADFSDAFASALTAHRSVDFFNVIPGQAGGLHRAQRLVHLAESAGIGALLGSTVELGPGTAAASDLVGPGLLVDDVVSPRIRYDDGTLGPSAKPGLGVTLDRNRLERYRWGD